MTLLIIVLAVVVAVAFVWFAYPSSRAFIAGAVATAAIAVAGVLTGLASWLQGLA